MDPSQSTITLSTNIQYQFYSAAKMIPRGGSQEYMALNMMLIRSPFWRSYVRSEQDVRDLGC